MGIETGSDGDPASIAEKQFEGLPGGSSRGDRGGDGIRDDGDGEEVGSGVRGGIVRGSGLWGGDAVEVFPEDNVLGGYPLALQKTVDLIRGAIAESRR